MTPLDAAMLCQRSYEVKPTIGESDSASALDIVDGTHCFRGTANAQGWFDAFNVDTIYVPGLGCVEAGFWSALSVLLPKVDTYPPPKVICGHSLGAAMAILYAAVWALRGVVVPLFAIEPPRPCADQTVEDLFAQTKLPWYACRNGLDIVTDLPPELSLPGSLTPIGHASLPIPNWYDHGIARVVAALRAEPA